MDRRSIAEVDNSVSAVATKPIPSAFKIMIGDRTLKDFAEIKLRPPKISFGILTNLIFMPKAADAPVATMTASSGGGIILAAFPPNLPHKIIVPRVMSAITKAFLPEPESTI